MNEMRVTFFVSMNPYDRIRSPTVSALHPQQRSRPMRSRPMRRNRRGLGICQTLGMLSRRCRCSTLATAVPATAVRFAMEGRGVVGELLAKHRASSQPPSRTLCAVLAATLEVLKAENIEPSPPALFAATMASLEKPQGYSTPEVRLSKAA